MSHHHALDNPVWNALSESHRSLSIQFDNLKCYHPDYCPFGAYFGTASIANGIFQYADMCDNFFIVGEQPKIPPGLRVQKELVCDQMILDHAVNISVDEEIVLLGDAHADALFQLVTLVQPGYFRAKTRLLGTYFGIFKNNQLVAVTGERMRMNDYTEVSAVVTHPDYTGRGFSKQLVAHAIKNILAQNKIPFLHVTETNTQAIRLYEKSGFKLRRKMSFWNLVK